MENRNSIRGVIPIRQPTERNLALFWNAPTTQGPGGKRKKEQSKISAELTLSQLPRFFASLRMKI